MATKKCQSNLLLGVYCDDNDDSNDNDEIQQH